MHSHACTHTHTHTHTKLAIIIVTERLSLMFEGTHSWSQIMSGIKLKIFSKIWRGKNKERNGDTNFILSLSRRA